MDQICVSLDLETTGLSAENDDIIEIAAVRFQGDHVLDSFHTVVNPLRPLPYFIQLLVGITQAEVDAAPRLESVLPGLVSFVGSCPIVGHNIGFDLGFLASKGVTLDNQTYDTLELARLLMPALANHKLTSVASALAVDRGVQHRALSDAEATRGVFLRLCEAASALPPTLSREIQTLTGSGSALCRFLSDIEKEQARRAFTGRAERVAAAEERPPDEPLTPRAVKKLLDIEALSQVFSEGGPLAGCFPGYERRSEQVRMMQAVAEALNQGHHLLVEAGTGTGKSMAYLLPALAYALQNNAPVVVSTNTINLQEQLIGKDIPTLLRALEQASSLPPGRPKAVTLKGRTNYLCRRRWNLVRQGGRLSPDEGRTLARLLVWLSASATGDRSEVNLPGADTALWNKVCAQSENCLGGNCVHQRKGTCFVHRARDEARSAHLIIVNHALLLSDLASESQVLPPYKHLIVDEAHHLEDEATDQFGFDVSQQDLFDHLGRLGGENDGRAVGLLADISLALSHSNAASAQEHVQKLIGELQPKIAHARDRVSQFFDAFWDFLQRYGPNGGEYERRIRFTSGTRAQPAWSDIEIAWENTSIAWSAIEGDLNKLRVALEPLSEFGVADYDSMMLELSSLIRSTSDMRQRLNSVVVHPEKDTIYWAALGDWNKTVTLRAAPLSVASVLQEKLFSAKDSVVLTGATLTTESHFHYVKVRLGLEEAEELALGSPFNYLQSTLIYLPNDMPEPSKPDYQERLARALLDVCRAAGGRTLALFTAHRALKEAHAAIRSELEEDGILALAHGVDGSPKQLLNMFKEVPRAALLGASSFWEGVDVVGEALSVLVITRLPFNVPTEPVFNARSEMFDDPFHQYALPQAVIRFRQGFGRLIRSRTDRGVIVVLDSRLQGKKYGAAFLHSLPPCTIKIGPSRNLPAEIKGWLGPRKGEK
ncbi:MAG: helicase C-terminal domain-containing protein [Dehalococcoidia bacterium]|nr:helicase C-terminal domain-containing protein [Dehalococcoidia bacterium]